MVIYAAALPMKMKLLSLLALLVATVGSLPAQDPSTPAKPEDAKPDAPAEIKVYTLTDEEKAAGWQMVFDGKNNYALRGLTYNDFINRGWKIDRGSLFCVKDFKDMGLMTGGHIITQEQYLDFEFAFEWKLSVSGRSGIMYEATGTREKPEGLVYAIVDDVHNPDGLKGGPIKRTGALYGIIPPAADKKLNGPDNWNEGRILVEGNHVEHWLNGQKVVEFDLGSPEFQQKLAAAGVKPNSMIGRKFKTAIVIRDDGEEVEFRNLRIRPIWNAATPATPAPRVAR